MKRIMFMIFRLFYIAPYYFARVWWMSRHIERYDEDTCFSLLKKMVTRANRAGRVIIEPHGIEHIPEQDGFVFFPNHQGMFDVLAFLECCPKKFRTVMKREIAEGILTKQIRTLLRGKMIDRDDVRSHIQLIQEMSNDCKNGKNFIMFAEGTRSKKGNRLLDFKGGSFKCATKARCPIVPVALIDSYKAFDTSSIKPVTVQVHFMEPLLYEEYKNMKSVEIAELIKKRIEEVISKNVPEEELKQMIEAEKAEMQKMSNEEEIK